MSDVEEMPPSLHPCKGLIVSSWYGGLGAGRGGKEWGLAGEGAGLVLTRTALCLERGLLLLRHCSLAVSKHL